MRIIESRSIDNQAGLLGSRLITGTSTIEGAFQSFIVAEDTIVSKVYNSIGIDVTQKLGLTSVTLKAGAFISMAKGDCFSSIKLTSGSVVAYFVSHGGMTITADAYMNEFLARVGSSYLEAAECAKATLQSLINIGLLQKASLIMSPSMYQEGLVKSVVPQDGSGDLSFTRASNGTRINSAGLVEVMPWNLLQNSENFSIDFTPINASISNNTTTAPNGTTTADSLIENTATDNHTAFGDSTQQSGVEYTYSVYAKSIGGRNIRVFGSSGFGGDVIVDLANGSVLSGSGVVQSVGNGWFRISITATTTTSAVRAIFYIVNGTSVSYTGNGTSGVYLWGAQLNIGSTAKPYFPTTDRLNVPRLTYQNGGGGCPSLLLEKQSTNILLNSGELNSWLQIDTSVTSNSTISPDGTQNADTVIATGSGSLAHLIYQNLAFTSGTAYTYSVFAKANTSNFIQMVFAGDFVANSYANFNLSNGTITASANLTPKIESMGNGWYRCSISATAGVSNTNSQIIYLINSGTASRGQAFTANGESVYLWGGQFEASSYVTTLIPTTSASATRVEDACFKTGISSLIGQTEGTIFLDIETIAENSDWFTISPVSGSPYSNGIGIGYYVNSVRVQLYSSTNGIFATLSSITGRNKIAVAYKSGDTAIYINGTSVFTSATTFVFGVNLDGIKLLSDSWVTGAMQKAQANEALLFKTRLTNAELASLTTI
jgi:hypothetical protein